GPLLLWASFIAWDIQPSATRRQYQPGGELLQSVDDTRGLAGDQRIFDLEGQAHIEPVQPDLMGIALLVPVIARENARVLVELADQAAGRSHVAQIARLPIEEEEDTARQDIVDIVFLRVIAGEAPIGRNLARYQPQQVVQPALLAGCLVEQHQAAI